MQQLPIGISTFKKIREGNYVYVDKTSHVFNLSQGSYYFLSRPRRFGKSLFVDTLHEAFSGNRELFEGLALEPLWDWSQTNPVISINLAQGKISSKEELDLHLREILSINAERLAVDLALTPTANVAIAFGQLIRKTFEAHNKRVVVLVDEYDKPLLDALLTPEVKEIRHGLQNFYSVLKAHDKHLRFVFLTGISKFSRVSVFSELNNLDDITLDSRYGTICGYTQAELEHYFAAHLGDVDLAQVKAWYNGYSWDAEKVYNPFNILLFLEKNHEYRPYWSSTSTPSFLVNLFKSRSYHIPDLENVEATNTSLDNFDVDHIDIESLLFQAGYLTIKSKDVSFGKPMYHLGFPNQEVRTAFNEILLKNYLLDNPRERDLDVTSTLRALRDGKLDDLQVSLEALFAGIANDNYRNNKIADYEGFYAAVIYAYFNSLGIETHAEDTTSRGRIDLTLRLKNQEGQKVVYVLEFKMAKGTKTADSENSALEQIELKGYADKYRTSDVQAIYLVGIEFSSTIKSISSFKSKNLLSEPND